DLGPLAQELGADAAKPARTNFGQTLKRLNRVSYDVSLLTQYIGDGKGGLNPNGTLQRLVTSSEMYNNFNDMATAARDVFARARPAISNLNIFADKVARDPGAISRGALS